MSHTTSILPPHPFPTPYNPPPSSHISPIDLLYARTVQSWRPLQFRSRTSPSYRFVHFPLFSLLYTLKPREASPHSFPTQPFFHTARIPFCVPVMSPHVSLRLHGPSTAYPTITHTLPLWHSLPFPPYVPSRPPRIAPVICSFVA